MEENDIEYNYRVPAIDQRIWSLFDILRNELIASEDYYVLLLLLSLYKDGIISNRLLTQNTDVHDQILARIYESNTPNTSEYLVILQSFEPILKRLSSNGLKSLIQTVLKIDKVVISDNFAELFDNVLFQITKSQGRFGGEFVQPNEITRFICNLADLPKKAKVFNPFAGLASFGVYLDQGQDYLGQEINQKTWSLGTLRLIAYERADSYNYICDDSILHWPGLSQKFDLIVANPPFGLRLSPQQKDACPDIINIEHFLIKKGLESLKENGKMIALLSQGALFRGGREQQLRKELIEQDLIETIISLPGGLLSNTGIPLVILVINKDKKSSGKVRFIDAEKFIEQKSKREKILKDEELNKLVRGNNQDSDAVRIIDNSQIAEFDYNLNVPRYFQNKIEGVKLRDLLETVNGQRNNLPSKGKIIRISNLKDDNIDFKLDLYNVEKTGLNRPDLRLIEESCLLLATRWKTLKPTLFEFSNSPILVASSIFSFKINEEIVAPAYLINELQSEYVKDQLDSRRIGSTIPMIRRSDLLEIIIKVPSLDEQRAKVEGIFELSDKIKNFKEQRNIRAHVRAVNHYNEFASLKHTLGRPRQNILDWTDNLLHFFNENSAGLETLNKSFLDFYETDLISALKEIKHDVNFMTDVLEKGENGFIIEEYDQSPISLSDINNIINEISSNGFNFKIKKLLLNGEDLKEKGIYGNKILFKILIDNLLTNANKYGFERNKKGNEVVFELTEVDDFLLMEVRNNGKPFPKNYDREKFITKYSTTDMQSGTGMGGYDINRIAKRFNNPDWELTLNIDPIYPVKFEFQFKINPTY